MKSILFSFLAFLISNLVFSQNCSPDSLQIREIKAFATDNNIDWELQNHQVYINPDCIQNGKVLLHLVGSFDSPTSTTYFQSLAANHGFKVITLKYPNNVSAAGACGNSTDIDCFWKYRQEIVFGQNTSSDVAVDADNCIINRFEKLLIYLQANFTSEGWGSFLNGSSGINWEHVLVSGHSQGGGHAAFIAKSFEVERVIMFASPNDYSNNFNAPAPWISSISATADSNYYSFGNRFDDVVDFNKQYEVWDNMGLFIFGDSMNVENYDCFYHFSHVLYTSNVSSAGQIAGNHNSVIIDNYTPLYGASPVFTPEWKYLLGLCGGSANTIEATGFTTEEFHLYPNPVYSGSTIFYREVIMAAEIYSVSGQLVTTIKPNQNQFIIPRDLQTGTYLIKVKHLNANKEQVEILIVK